MKKELIELVEKIRNEHNEDVKDCLIASLNQLIIQGFTSNLDIIETLEHFGVDIAIEDKAGIVIALIDYDKNLIDQAIDYVNPVNVDKFKAILTTKLDEIQGANILLKVAGMNNLTEKNLVADGIDPDDLDKATMKAFGYNAMSYTAGINQAYLDKDKAKVEGMKQANRDFYQWLWDNDFLPL